MSSYGGTSFQFSDARSHASSMWDNISVWSSEGGMVPNTVGRFFRFIFAADLYLSRGRTTQTIFVACICLTALLIALIQLGMMAESEILATSAAKLSLVMS